MPIVDPYRSQSYVGDQPFIAGWGRLKEGGKTSNKLQFVRLPVLTNAECKQRFQVVRKLISEQQFGSAVMCAGDLNGGRDSCQGDR